MMQGSAREKRGFDLLSSGKEIEQFIIRLAVKIKDSSSQFFPHTRRGWLLHVVVVCVRRDDERKVLKGFRGKKKAKKKSARVSCIVLLCTCLLGLCVFVCLYCVSVRVVWVKVFQFGERILLLDSNVCLCGVLCSCFVPESQSNHFVGLITFFSHTKFFHSILTPNRMPCTSCHRKHQREPADVSVEAEQIPGTWTFSKEIL